MQSSRKPAYLLAVLAGSSLGYAGTIRGPLHTVHEINALDNSDAKHGYPVQLEGVVTYSDPEWGLLFIEDNTGAIYVNVHGVSKTFLPGTRIMVNAATGAGDIAPSLVKAQVRVLGKGSLPRAAKLSLAQLDGGAGDSRYVTTEGVLRPGTRPGTGSASVSSITESGRLW